MRGITEGKVVGGYTLVRNIGSGGNAEVWLASGAIGEVAIKFLKAKNPDSEPYKRFMREIEKLEELRDEPGIVTILGHSLLGDDYHPWFAMQLATPLQTALGDGESVEQIVEAIQSIASTLATVHDRGLSHRDIKPENLFQTESGWAIGDFGLVDFPGAPPLTAAHKKVGPVHYIAPEMLDNADVADGRPADVYGLAKSLWVLLTGQRYPLPGEHPPGQGLVAQYNPHPRIAAIDTLIQRMTSLDVHARPTMRTVSSELATWISNAPLTVGQAPTDLRTLAQQAIDSSRWITDIAKVREERRARVAHAFAIFQEVASVLHDDIVRAEIPVYGGPPGMLNGPFNTDASEEIAAIVGPLATMKLLGAEPPITMAGGIFIQPHSDLPSLKIWVGISNVRGAPEVTLGAGASIMIGRYVDRIQQEDATVLLDGPAMFTQMHQLTAAIREKLTWIVEKWTEAYREAADRMRDAH
ncbi:serine/threonine-protein kinase [Fodinicola acaciae]|uniref:serine/threonine-protein kinase n=1 Tax=Fodinicola acaciae TaxID=2681555 RepID=UPI0013D36A75|nr:serine/threonine-protein kinase [Fodinicola acaciae]